MHFLSLTAVPCRDQRSLGYDLGGTLHFPLHALPVLPCHSLHSGSYGMEFAHKRWCAGPQEIVWFDCPDKDEAPKEGENLRPSAEIQAGAGRLGLQNAGGLREKWRMEQAKWIAVNLQLATAMRCAMHVDMTPSFLALLQQASQQLQKHQAAGNPQPQPGTALPALSSTGRGLAAQHHEAASKLHGIVRQAFAVRAIASMLQFIYNETHCHGASCNDCFSQHECSGHGLQVSRSRPTTETARSRSSWKTAERPPLAAVHQLPSKLAPGGQS